MNNIYTARFFDYFGWEMEQLTRQFSTMQKARTYFQAVCNHRAIPFAQLDRNEQAINMYGQRIGANCDSRQY